MSILLDAVFFFLSCAVLVKSSGYLVKSLVKISSYLKLNEFTVGFIIMAVSTSLPELFVGIISAIEGEPMLSLGNAIGSNILDLTIVIGLVTVLAKGIKIKSKIIRRDLVYMVLIVLAPVVLMNDHLFWSRLGIVIEQGITRIDGAVLLIIFGLYIWNLIKQEKLFRKTIDRTSAKETLKYVVMFFMSVIVLVVSSKFAVDFASRLSVSLNISDILIGIFILSLGTSLPELVFETKAVLNRHQEMAIGDLIGSVIANSSLVIGVTAVIHPITGDMLAYLISIMFMLLISFIFMTFAESDRGLSWKEGMSLIMLYLFFMITEIYIKGMI